MDIRKIKELKQRAKEYLEVMEKETDEEKINKACEKSVDILEELSLLEI